MFTGRRPRLRTVLIHLGGALGAGALIGWQIGAMAPGMAAGLLVLAVVDVKVYGLASWRDSRLQATLIHLGIALGSGALFGVTARDLGFGTIAALITLVITTQTGLLGPGWFFGTGEGDGDGSGGDDGGGGGGWFDFGGEGGEG